MSAITFEWDSRDLAVFRGGAVEKALARSMRLAGNQAFKTLRVGATRIAKSRKNLPEKYITDDQREQKPSRSTELRNFAWTLFIKGTPVPASKFPHLDTRRLRSGNGVLVRYGTGGTTRITGAFVATMKSGHVGIFTRSTTKKMKSNHKRWAIDQHFSYRLPSEFGGEVMSALSDPTYRKLEEAFKRGLDRELGKLRRKGAL